MKLLVLVLTRTTKDPLIDEGLSYLKKLRPPFTSQVVFLHPKVSDDIAKRKVIEGRELLLKSEGYLRVALTEHGTQFSSPNFAAMIERQSHSTSKMAFLVGGAFGFSDEVLSACHARISLSAMTMPHRMAFLVLAEQLFRAAEILNQTPYHK